MQNGYPLTSITAVSREFNLRYHAKRITVHAVRKWLQGEAIPAQDKMQVLADWLGVPVHWLRFGEAPQQQHSAAPNSNIDARIFSKFQKLDDRSKLVVEDLILSLLRRLPEDQDQQHD
jgi:transcriptional regulator with XRE-family HTH domain